MKFANLLPAFVACSHAMLIPHMESEGSLKKRADSTGASDNDITPLHYIVVFKKGESESAYKAHDEWVAKQFSALKKRGVWPDGVSGQVDFFNVLNFMGYTGYLPPTVLESVKKDPLVDFVEVDQMLHSMEFATQGEAPWGIARISQRANKKSAEYDYDDVAGTGVTAYVLDSGIKVEHPDFDGRAKWGPSFVPPYLKVDEYGHGTHVAGTLGAKTYGVAKKVELVAVQILDPAGRGPFSAALLGIQYAVRQHQAKVSNKVQGYRGAVINLSAEGPASLAMDLAVNAAIDAGVHVIVAAGNENRDACKFSPARATGPITVGATDANDTKANYSNWGSCVNVQAPGTDILSTGVLLATEVRSGTSMASPHVAGIISTFMSLQPDLGSEFLTGGLIKPADLKRKFLGFSTKDVVAGLDKASPNLLSYNGAGLSLHDLWIL